MTGIHTAMGPTSRPDLGITPFLPKRQAYRRSGNPVLNHMLSPFYLVKSHFFNPDISRFVFFIFIYYYIYIYIDNIQFISDFTSKPWFLVTLRRSNRWSKWLRRKQVFCARSRWRRSSRGGLGRLVPSKMVGKLDQWPFQEPKLETIGGTYHI